MTLILPPIRRRGIGELIFQVDAVIDHDDLEIVEVGGGAEHAGDEDHGERFAGPWVCQTTPERCSGVLPMRSRSRMRRAARYCW